MSEESTSSTPQPQPQQQPQQPIQKCRLEIPCSMYSINPIQSIKQLLGQNVTIISHSSNDIVTENDTLIIDVEYTSIPFSLLKIYYVNVSELKRLIPNCEKYVATINGCNVKISSPKLKEFSKVLPIKIKPTLSNNYTSSGQIDSQFSYYGSTVSSPMNYLCSPLKYINHSFEPFDTEEIKPIYTPEFKTEFEKKVKDNHQNLFDEMMKYYKQSTSTFNILSSVDHVTSDVKSFSDCKIGTTGYVIPFNIIPTDKDINGIILIQPKRLPEYVLFYPTNNFTICSEELISIKKFIEQDKENFYNFNYVRDVLNK